jgi:hypothetical protein
MKFTGTLIEDLMAAVERAERKEPCDEALVMEGSKINLLLVESLLVEPWFAAHENTDYDSKFIGVA